MEGQQRTSRGPGSSSRADDQRQRIGALAANIFGVQGYRATSMTEIAAAAQLAKPTLYHYFRSKEELLVRIYEEVLDESLASVEAISNSNPDPLQALKEILTQRVVYTCENQQLLKICFEEENELPPHLTETLFRRRRALEEVILHRLAQLLDAKNATLAVAPRIYVNACLGAVNWVYKWYDPHGARTPTELGNDIANLLLAPLRELTLVNQYGDLQ